MNSKNKLLNNLDFATKDHDIQSESISKSELKREAEDLKKLGMKLIKLKPNELSQIPLTDDLLQEIKLAQTIKKEGLRRQIQFIGKLLRNIDITNIQNALNALNNQNNIQLLLQKKIERYRDNLLESGDQYVFEIKEKYPNINVQHLRNLIRGAKKEPQKQNNKFLREIYIYLKHVMQNSRTK